MDDDYRRRHPFFPTKLLPFQLSIFSSSLIHIYISHLGGVIVGIGITLLLEAYGQPRGVRGLGLGVAIAINFCGAGILALWLIFEPLNLPPHGLIILWVVAIGVLGLGLLELLAKTWRYD